MAVAIIQTDTWIARLLFTGGRRDSDFGPADGVFYGVVSGDGDASGGNFTLNGLLSFEKKEDWVYLIKKVSVQTNDIRTTEGFIVVSTGPQIITGSSVVNPSFQVGGDFKNTTNNATSSLALTTGSGDHFTDLLVFGDKKIPGSQGMIAAGLEGNVNGSTATLSVYGLLYRYSSFFRNVGNAFG